MKYTMDTEGSYKSDNVELLGEAAALKKINKRFSSGKIAKGLTALEELLTYCSDITFTSSCVKWLQFCCRIGDNDTAKVTCAGLKMFGKIIVMSVKFPELVRPIANSVVSRYLEVFAKRLGHLPLAWETLEILMHSYSGPIAAHKDSLEATMKEKLTGTDRLPEWQARCFALLPSVGGGGVKAVAYKTNWKSSFDLHLNTCHYLLGQLFKDVNELQSYDGETELNFPENPTFAETSVQIENVCSIIRAMLLGKFPAPKTIAADAVVGLICRGLSVNSATLGGKELARTAELQAALPTVHKSLLRILSALSVCCGRALLPLSAVISKVLGQILQAAADSPSLRVEVYEALVNWMTVAGSGSCVDLISNNLISALLKDVSIKTPAVGLKEKGKTTEPSRSKLESFNEFGLVTLAALQTLNTFLNSQGYLLSAGQNKMIQSTVIEVATKLQRRAGEYPSVYGASAQARTGLYGVLIQLCLESCPQWPPPTQFALQILRCGLNDNDQSVKTVCSSGLSILERLVHPEFTVAAFPVDYAAVLKDIQRTEEREAPLPSESVTSTPPAKTKLVTKSSSPWDYFGSKKTEAIIPVNGDSEIVQPKSPEIDIVEIEADVRSSPLKVNSQNDESSENTKNCSSESAEPVNENDVEIIESNQGAQTEVVKLPKKRQWREVGGVIDLDDIERESKNVKIVLEVMKLTENENQSTEVTLSNSEEVDCSEISEIEVQGANNVAQILLEKHSSPSTGRRTPEPKVYNLRSKALDSPMSLRSGSTVGGSSSCQETRRRVREGSVSSQSSVSLSQKRSDSPRSELSECDDVIALFDETIRQDYK